MLERLSARPDPALSHLFDFCLRPSAIIRGKGLEAFVNTFNARAQNCAFSGIGTMQRGAEFRQFSGTVAVPADIKFSKQSFRIRDHREDADRAGKRQGIRDDALCAEADPIAPGSRRIAHARDNMDAPRSDGRKLLANRLRRNGVSSRTRDAQNQSTRARSLCRLFKTIAKLFG